MCVTDRHDMTLAVKVALNVNTTNQPTIFPIFFRNCPVPPHPVQRSLAPSRPNFAAPIEIRWLRLCRTQIRVRPFACQGTNMRHDSVGCYTKWITSLHYREYIYSVAVYQKYLTRLGESIIFEPWRENYHFSQPS